MAAIAAIFYGYLGRCMSVLISLSEIRMAAMNLLAMREHSAKELVEKLERKFPQSDLIQQAVSVLAEQNLQSDERFADAFVKMRQRQGKGSILIKMELRERGIASDLINTFLDETDEIWFSLAREVRAKRFKSFPRDGREKAKQIRFLQSRGFASRHIQGAFSEAFTDS